LKYCLTSVVSQKFLGDLSNLILMLENMLIFLAVYVCGWVVGGDRWWLWVWQLPKAAGGDPNLQHPSWDLENPNSGVGVWRSAVRVDIIFGPWYRSRRFHLGTGICILALSINWAGRAKPFGSAISPHHTP